MEDEARPVGDAGRVPRRDDQDAHEADPTPLTVVICCRDRPEQLAETLASLPTALREGDEIIVVDSASSDPRVAEVAIDADVRLLRCDRPGLARARNVGWTAARTPIVAFTDDDCFPKPGWAAAIAAALRDGQHAFAYGRALPGTEGEPLSVLDDPRPATVTADIHPSELGGGLNCAARREVLAAVGGFDVHLGVGTSLPSAEDSDLFLRLLAAGWTGRYVPEATVIHEHRRDRRQALRTSYGYGVGEGALAVKHEWLYGERRSPGPVGTALRYAATDLAAGYEFGVVASLVRAVGAVVGRWRVHRYDLEDGHLVAPTGLAE